jgi:hypothetical protein
MENHAGCPRVGSRIAGRVTGPELKVPYYENKGEAAMLVGYNKLPRYGRCQLYRSVYEYMC